MWSCSTYSSDLKNRWDVGHNPVKTEVWTVLPELRNFHTYWWFIFLSSDKQWSHKVPPMLTPCPAVPDQVHTCYMMHMYTRRHGMTWLPVENFLSQRRHHENCWLHNWGRFSLWFFVKDAKKSAARPSRWFLALVAAALGMQPFLDGPGYELFPTSFPLGIFRDR